MGVKNRNFTLISKCGNLPLKHVMAETLKIGGFGHNFFKIGVCYKGKFKISLKLQFFLNTQIDPFMETKFGPCLVPFFWAPKTNLVRHENKEKLIFYLGLRLLYPIQIQLSEIENPKNPKIDSPNWLG
jgi:hypothetical protein